MPIHVMAAALRKPNGEILLARRPDHVHQGGLWEFPGGKREAGETPWQALRRELHEELGIELRQARPLIRIRHEYPDKSVLLDVWLGQQWDGEPHGREGQPLQWRLPAQMNELRFPAANLPIVRALQLPPLYLITPYPQGEAFFQELQASLEAGARLLQFRAKTLPETEWISAASRAVELCRRYGASLLLNAEPARAVALAAAGTHLDCRRLWAWQQRPVPASVLLAASCHTAEDLAQARRIGVDFVVLSPVRPTRSHPQAPPLGWQRFSELAEQAAYPVYALGGMGAAHLSWAWAHGGQGVAGISEFWGQPAAIGRILRDEA